MTKLNEFLARKATVIRSLLRAIRLRDVPWLLLGFVAMILIPMEKDVPQSRQAEEHEEK